jgi:hypothetical protein
LWLEATPSLFFPWRVSLALAHLLWGALDRTPLVLLGSVPSLVSSAWAALKNIRRAEEFREATTEGLRRHVESRVSERLAVLVGSLQESLAVDLRRSTSERDRPVEEVRVEGISELQARTTAALDEAIERQAPGALTAVGAALVGTLLFWGVAGWPLYALYLDYFKAAVGAWWQIRDALQHFPAPSFGLLFTAVLLGLLPMGVWLVIVAGWVTRPSRVHRCLSEVRGAHERVIRDLLAAGLLRVRLTHPAWSGCRVLLED